MSEFSDNLPHCLITRCRIVRHKRGLIEFFAKVQKKSEPPKDKVEILRLPPYLSTDTARTQRDRPFVS